MTTTSPSGVVRQFIQFAQFNGLQLETLLDADTFAHIQASLRQDYVAAHALVDALQQCAMVTGRPDLGLAFASSTNLRGFGPLSILWDHCGSLGEWITVSERYLHVENAALGTAIDINDDEVAMRNFLMLPSRYGGSQFLQFVMGLELRLARRILGDDWTPLRAEFDCPAPDSQRYHRSSFGCPLVFDSEHCSVIVHRNDLRRESPYSNPQMLAFLERNLMVEARAPHIALVYHVEKLVTDKLAAGSAQLDHVAGLLGLSGRHLQRQLAAHGESFGAILIRVRRRLAMDYIAHRAYPNLLELANRLGYGDASATSRFLTQEFGAGLRRLTQIFRGETPEVTG